MTRQEMDWQIENNDSIKTKINTSFFHLCCPFCGNPAMHIIGPIENKNVRFSYCKDQMKVVCESNPQHQYVFFFGDHKAEVTIGIAAVYDSTYKEKYQLND